MLADALVPKVASALEGIFMDEWDGQHVSFFQSSFHRLGLSPTQIRFKM